MQLTYCIALLENNPNSDICGDPLEKQFCTRHQEEYEALVEAERNASAEVEKFGKTVHDLQTGKVSVEGEVETFIADVRRCLESLDTLRTKTVELKTRFPIDVADDGQATDVHLEVSKATATRMLERLESRRKELEEAARIQRYKDEKKRQDEEKEKERLEKERLEKERQEKEKATPSTSVQSASSSDCEWEERGTWSKIGIVFGVTLCAAAVFVAGSHGLRSNHRST